MILLTFYSKLELPGYYTLSLRVPSYMSGRLVKVLPSTVEEQQVPRTITLSTHLPYYYIDTKIHSSTLSPRQIKAISVKCHKDNLRFLRNKNHRFVTRKNQNHNIYMCVFVYIYI